MEKENKLFGTQNLIKMALMSVVAVLLMQYGAIKLPMFFPSFLEIDLSEVPAIVGILTIHPMAGIVIVILKNVLKAFIFGSSSAYVGEIANLVVSIGYVLPLTVLAKKNVNIKTVIVGIIAGIFGMTIAGAFINYFVTFPLYAKLFMPMETIIAMGTAIYPGITDKFTLILFSVTPFNLLKGIVVAGVSIAFVKSIQPVIHYLAHKRV